MAGRRPRIPRDELAGVTPLQGWKPGGRTVTPERREKVRENARAQKTREDAAIAGLAAKAGEAAARVRPGGRPNRGKFRGVSGIDPETGVWTPAYPGQRPPFAPGQPYIGPPGNPYAFAPGNKTAGSTGTRDPDRWGPLAEMILEAALGDPGISDVVKSPMFFRELASWARAEAAADLAFKACCKVSFDEAITPRSRGGQAMKSPDQVYSHWSDKAAAARAKLGLSPASYSRIVANLGLAGRAVEDGIAAAISAGGATAARRLAAIDAGQGS